MSLPFPPNTTCDIYRAGRAPPQAPDVANVPCYLVARGQSTLTTENYTHLLYVDAKIDLRDAYQAATLTAGAQADQVYVPNGTDAHAVNYGIILVRRYGRGTALDHKRALVIRAANPGWPTDNL
jgi:hypothetical protein